MRKNSFIFQIRSICSNTDFCSENIDVKKRVGNISGYVSANHTTIGRLKRLLY